MSNENKKTNEKVINVPLAPAVKKSLEEIADRNGRATGREAARAVADYVRRNGGEGRAR